jgi:hypothetical protein
MLGVRIEVDIWRLSILYVPIPEDRSYSGFGVCRNRSEEQLNRYN